MHSGDTTMTGSSFANRGGCHYIRALCKSTVFESFQVYSYHLPAPPRLDYSLPLPSSIDAAYPFPARLDSAKAEVGPSTAIVCHVTPNEGFTTTLETASLGFMQTFFRGCFASVIPATI